MPSDPKRVQAIFLAALEYANTERPALLDRECGPDSELRQRVEALLKAYDEPDSFLEKPAVADDANVFSPTVDMPTISEGVGTVIGHYKLLQQIGEGGMGAVYLAEQEEPVRRRVALKIIKPGMDSRQVVADASEARRRGTRGLLASGLAPRY